MQTLSTVDAVSGVGGSLSHPQQSSDELNLKKKRSFRVKMKDFLNSITLTSTSMLLVSAAFGVGYKVGSKNSSAAATASAAAGGAVVRRTSPPTSVIAILALVLVRDIWRALPIWIKRQIPYLGRKYKAAGHEGHADDPNDMSSMTAITTKLGSLFDSASEKLSTPFSGSNAQVAFFSLLQLFSQLKAQASETRDELFDESGETVDNPSELLKGYDQLFEFADWAYDEIPDNKSLKQALLEEGYIMIRHDVTSLPGSVDHYVAIQPETKKALIGVKGTSRLEDMITDLCGLAVSKDLPGPFVKGSQTSIRCHDGIYTAAARLADELEPLVKEFFLPNKYQILVTGHSLGAGAAALSGLLLRSRFSELINDKGSRMKVVAFASPPILDHDAALACSDFCTTVVNNSDIIPRSSLSNLLVLMNFMKSISRKLEDQGAAPSDFKSVAGYMKLLSQGQDGEMIMTPDEIEKELGKAYEEVDVKDPDSLYVPGTVYQMYDLWSKPGYGEVTEEIDQKTTEDGVHMTSTSIEHRTAERVHIANGVSKTLRLIELDSRMLSDHLSPGYRSSIRALLNTNSTADESTG